MSFHLMRKSKSDFPFGNAKIATTRIKRGLQFSISRRSIKLSSRTVRQLFFRED